MLWLLVAIVFQLALSGRLPVYVGLVSARPTSSSPTVPPVVPPVPPVDAYRPDLP